ncbi:MAG: hypothetical protein RIC55_22500 [Pirellulaceae bacterium]
MSPMTSASDSDDELRLAPDEAATREQTLAKLDGRRHAALPLSDDDRRRIAPLQRPRPRFTIAEMLTVTTVVCVGLAGASTLPRGVFAGASGIAALILLLTLQFTTSISRGLRMTLWCLLGAYLIAAAASLLVR